MARVAIFFTLSVVISTAIAQTPPLSRACNIVQSYGYVRLWLGSLCVPSFHSLVLHSHVKITLHQHQMVGFYQCRCVVSKFILLSFRRTLLNPTINSELQS